MAVNPISQDSAPLDAVALEPAARNLPFAFAKRNGVLFQDREHGVLKAIYRRGTAPLVLAEVRRFAGGPVRFAEVDAQAFDAKLQAAYESGAAMTMVEGLDGETDLLAVAQQLPEPSDLIDSDDEAPIIRLINALLTQAVKDNASDIHIEPFENRMTVRFRIDGVLREVLQSKRAVAPLVVSRIKVMVEARHRGEAPAAGRPHLAADRGARRRRARVDDPVGPRRARRAALARQASRPPHAVESRHVGPGPGADGRARPSPARHLARDRPDGLRQDHDALRGARADQRPLEQHPDRRGPDRVPDRRHRPDAGEHQGRA